MPLQVYIYMYIYTHIYIKLNHESSNHEADATKSAAESMIVNTTQLG